VVRLPDLCARRGRLRRHADRFAALSDREHRSHRATVDDRFQDQAWRAALTVASCAITSLACDGPQQAKAAAKVAAIALLRSRDRTSIETDWSASSWRSNADHAPA